jgi:hypothetical protein
MNGEHAMHKLAKIIVTCGLLSLPAISFADNTPNCDALDGRTDNNINIDTDLDFNDGDLVFTEDGVRRMVITEDRELFLDGERIELDARGQKLVDDYYLTFEDFIDDVTDLAGDAAGLGVSAAIEAVALVFNGEGAMGDFEARMEAKARDIEDQADRMCTRLRRIEGIELEMQSAVPGFEPLLFANN